MPIILAMQETEIRRIMAQGQPRQIVLETLSRKNPSQKSTGGVTQVVGPEFKPEYCKKKKKKKSRAGNEAMQMVLKSFQIIRPHQNIYINLFPPYIC
jgi:2-iminoacetate synthase ThiH